MKKAKFRILQTMFMLAGGMAISLPAAEPPSPSSQATDPLVPGGGASVVAETGQAGSANGWTEEIGGDFRKGAMETGFSLGASVGAHIFGGSETHDFALAKLLVGRVISDELGSDRWYRGYWEVLGEVFGGGQFKPGEAFVVGVTPGLRYDFATGTRWVPFFDAGAGATATDIGRPDLGGTFQFNLQTGPGLHWFVEKNLALTMQYRFLHLSSAGTELPNKGVNTSVFYVGMSWFF